jgi:Do/DeqQ family serine protease
MKHGFHRLVLLLLVFAAAFAGVSSLRSWQSGRGWLGWLHSEAQTDGDFRPEHYTLPDDAALNLDDVKLLARLNEEYSLLTRAVTPSVVSIDTAGERKVRLLDIWGRARIRSYPTQGQGSGVIVTKEGHVVTNHHVIADQQRIQITLHDGTIHPATLIGDDPLLDIAVLKIEGKGPFHPLKFGDSDQTKVGEMVFAVGNPFGLGETVTQGIISAKERSLSDSQRDLFQTDAAINPGNSGGPLINLRGEIIGINVAIFTPDRQNPGFQGVGFSIPGNDVRETLRQILERGRPIRGYLGVRMLDVTPQTAAAIDYKGRAGAVVVDITPDSPAKAAGLKPRDVVLEYDGEKIRSTQQFITLVQRSKVGREIKLKIWRDGKEMTLNAKIAESKPQTNLGAPAPDGDRVRGADEILNAIGVRVRDLSVHERIRGFRGVVVTGVVSNSLADPEVRRGDLIVAVNREPIGSAQEFYRFLSASAAVQKTTLNLVRGRSSLNITLPALPQEGG